MEYRQIGKSDLKLSEITFGAWAAGGWMWGGVEHNDSINAIRKAYDLGVTSIDTAPIYGMGFSEKIVAQAIKDIPRDQVQILTKFGLRWDKAQGEFYFNSYDNTGKAVDIYKNSRASSIIKECEQSLKRLGTDYIDLYQIHWPDATTPVEESFEAVETLIKQGKVRYAGVCNYSAEQMKQADKVVDIVSNQVPYSMVKRRIEKELVPCCLDWEKGILAYSPMERGLLTGKFAADHHFPEGDHRGSNPTFSSENIKKVNAFLDKIKPIAEAKGVSLAQLVLKWTVMQPGITIALAGARSPEQSVENAKAADIKLSEEEISLINKVLDRMF
ncbi:aldo/keto reductase [Robertkochia solimangrovi]|uniref:aldo/keto reductase n=1 Tax=Robertkochia solimangrovi TaxID=2213046 RepID=UPI00117F6BE2|nr:aldo/keto reductase [Robertkochia solimangrovi]TRZ42492.1 aldo/keto reductase [Robertkochia solimangrovi]